MTLRWYNVGETMAEAAIPLGTDCGVVTFAGAGHVLNKKLEE
jgi:hypothetical protein